MTRRPKGTSAGKRTREQMAEKLRDITGYYAVAEVRITPALYGDGTVWCAMAIASNRREIPLPGRAREIAALIRGAFPSAAWDRVQDYDVTTGTLTEHPTVMPSCLLGGDAL